MRNQDATHIDLLRDIIFPMFLVFLIFILSLSYFIRYLNYEKFDVYLSNNVQVIDLPSIEDYLTISAATDNFIGGSGPQVFDNGIGYVEITEGFDFALWNKKTTQIASGVNRGLGLEINRRSVMQRLGHDTVLFQYFITQSQENGEFEAYRIILGSRTDITGVVLNQNDVVFNVDKCNLRLIKVGESDLEFKTSNDIPRAILIETKYSQDTEIEFELVVDCE